MSPTPFVTRDPREIRDLLASVRATGHSHLERRIVEATGHSETPDDTNVAPGEDARDEWFAKQEADADHEARRFQGKGGDDE